MEPISTSTGTMISTPTGRAGTLNPTINILAPEMYTFNTREQDTTTTGVVLTTPPLSGALAPGVSVTNTGVGYTQTVSEVSACAHHRRTPHP